MLDDHLLSAVENAGIKRLVGHLELCYEMSDWGLISDRAISKKYKDVCEYISECMKTAMLSFTTDIWSSDVCPLSFLITEQRTKETEVN